MANERRQNILSLYDNLNYRVTANEQELRQLQLPNQGWEDITSNCNWFRTVCTDGTNVWAGGSCSALTNGTSAIMHGNLWLISKYSLC